MSQELALSEAELRDAIKTWCRGARYWACLKEGAVRVDLTGAEAGHVLPAEASRAKALETGRARRAPGNAQAKAQAGAKPVAEGDVAADAKVPAQGEMLTEVKASAESEAPTEVNASAESEAPTEVKVSAESEAPAEVKAAAETETAAEGNATAR